MSHFFWGSATSAHQVEGGSHNDWTEWERRTAALKVKDAKLKTWPEYILKNYPNPLQEENYISGRTCDHYNRYEEDFDLVKTLGHNAHRFSIEWSRIEPEEGRFDEKEIEHYRKVVVALQTRGLEPFVTLWHWTLPLWFRNQGGWLNKKSIEFFTRYAEKMATALPEVKFWITLNETNIYTSHGYLKGTWPPEYKSVLKYLKANHRLSRAHRAAYSAIKSANPSAEIGIAHHVIYFTGISAILKRFVWNNLFFRSIRNFQDFIGINYYHSDRNVPDRSEFQNLPVDPDGLFAVLKNTSAYGLPMYVTENGIADALDTKRAQFIKSHAEAIKKALAEGLDVQGYFYWSLLDNFEWSSGFWPRFGLVEIDYKTMERKIRPSAWEYKKIIERGL